MEIQSLYQAAIKFAAQKHCDQKVPGTELPYLVHLSNVAMEILVASSHTRIKDFDVELSVQIALLHDTIEDTDTSYNELVLHFGKDVADGVAALTKDNTLPEELRLADSLERIRKQPGEVWAVKLADRITNLQPPPKHWKRDKKLKYLEEARVIHQELKNGNQYLADRLRVKTLEYATYCNEYEYHIYEDDNFHWEDEDERDFIGTFGNREEALNICRIRVDDSLRNLYKPGFTPDELYGHYMNFGSDLFIRTDDKDCSFSAHKYAKERCEFICREMAEQENQEQ